MGFLLRVSKADAALRFMRVWERLAYGTGFLFPPYRNSSAGRKIRSPNKRAADRQDAHHCKDPMIA